ncbi:hypothetical protein ACWCYY_11970 [Kitasatospora sp. NPDC001664]
MPAPHRVVIAAFPGVELLDVTGPAEVFSVASRLTGGAGSTGSTEAAYQVRVATADGGPLTTSSGVRLLAEQVLERTRHHVVPNPSPLGHHITVDEIINYAEASSATHA